MSANPETIREVAAAFVEATDEREFPNWDAADRPSPFLIAIADKLDAARQEARTLRDAVSRLEPDLASANESLDQLTYLYQEKCDRICTLVAALRHISATADTLSPQEFINVCAGAIGVDRHEYAGECHPNKSLVEFHIQYLAAVRDLKPLMDYAESVDPVGVWGKNACLWAATRLTTLEQHIKELERAVTS